MRPLWSTLSRIGVGLLVLFLLVETFTFARNNDRLSRHLLTLSRDRDAQVARLREDIEQLRDQLTQRGIVPAVTSDQVAQDAQTPAAGTTATATRAPRTTTTQRPSTTTTQRPSVPPSPTSTTTTTTTRPSPPTTTCTTLLGQPVLCH